LDDVTPLEETAREATSTSVRFFPPRPAYRFLSGQKALLDYALKAKPKKEVQLTIVDANGKLVRELKTDAHEGLNRQSWDLRYEKPTLVVLRTTPPENPHIWSEPRFRDADSRPITHWGAEEAQVGPIAAPGKYTAKLVVDGESYAQPLEIIRDPESAADDEQLADSVNLQLRLRDDINTTSDMVNRIEWLRKQLQDLEKMAKSPQGKADLLARVQEVDQKLQGVEYKLITRSLALSDDKYFVEAYNVYFSLIWLNAEIGTGGGDVAGGADYGPTETSKILLDTIENELGAVKVEYSNVMDKDVVAFNQWLTGQGLTPVSGGSSR
jgi:hypothetical protein